MACADDETVCSKRVENFLCFLRRKRAADNDDDSSSTTNPVDGTYISDDLITSTDTVDPPPDRPLHQDAGFPTPSNRTEEMASDICRAAIQQTSLYDECLNYTANDTEYYVTSCVEDIMVIRTCTVVCTTLDRRFVKLFIARNTRQAALVDEDTVYNT